MRTAVPRFAAQARCSPCVCDGGGPGSCCREGLSLSDRLGVGSGAVLKRNGRMQHSNAERAGEKEAGGEGGRGEGQEGRKQGRGVVPMSCHLM